MKKTLYIGITQFYYTVSWQRIYRCSIDKDKILLAYNNDPYFGNRGESGLTFRELKVDSKLITAMYKAVDAGLIVKLPLNIIYNDCTINKIELILGHYTATDKCLVI